MKQVERFQWFITDSGTGKRRKTRHHMSREDALQDDPNAEPYLPSREVRELPESRDEIPHNTKPF